MAYRSYKPRGPVVKPERFTPPNGWGKQFENVFDFVTNGKGNGAIEAVAGGGKTSAVVESIIRHVEKNPNKRVLFVAFNVSIKDEGAKRLAGYNVDVVTCHGLGYRGVRKPAAWGGPDGRKQFDIQVGNGPYMQSLAEAEFGPEPESKSDREAFMDLISKAKASLAYDVESLVEIMINFGLNTDYNAAEFAEKALKTMRLTQERPGTAMVPGRGKGKGKLFHQTAITFDDQVWLPVVNDWKVDTYDAVFVDEAQDLSAARRALIKKALKPKGRFFACGDVFQAIYGFAMADIDSLPLLIEEFGCKQLPLSCSFRCATSIIAEAQEFNEIIEAAPNASEGCVDKLESENLVDKVKYGDVILSRTNAPLIKLFFRLARLQIKVKFIGRDYGRMLSYRIKGWQFKSIKDHGSFTGEDLLEYNDAWLQKQRESGSKDPENKLVNATERMLDEHETIIALTEDLNASMNSTAAVDEVLERCKAFSPDETKNTVGSDKFVTLSSVHRFKGLERDHAYVLTDTFKVGTNQEESNLMYVAVTRAKEHLTYVIGKDFKPKEDDDDV